MAREDGIDHLRDHSVVVTHNPGKNCRTGADPLHQVLAQLIFHAAAAKKAF